MACLSSSVSRLFAVGLVFTSVCSARSAENLYLMDVPDYAWHAGCFGTTSGNLIGFWDRNGFPRMYTGPTGGGVAPLDSRGTNREIRGLWASQEGVDGRPSGTPGHMEDYWESFDSFFSFESTAPDPYTVLGRPEHAPDCLGDFIGQSQRKYNDLNGECTGNIDGFAFNFWDKTGTRRTNFVPPQATRDIQSGLRAWSRSRGYEAEVASQLADVNPETPGGLGFTFEDIRAEINAGYPVMLLLQNHHQYFRPLTDMPRANPNGHAILVHGYIVTPGETGDIQAIRFKTSWGQGDAFAQWNSDIIIAALPLRGAITFRPDPKITVMERTGNQLRLEWDGPSATLYDETTTLTRPAHQYVIERATELSSFEPVTEASSAREATVNVTGAPREFFRVRLVLN